MKKLLLILLALTMCVSLCACGGGYSSPADAARAAAEAFFVNFDADAYFKADLNYNLDLVHKYVKDEATIKKIESAIIENQATMRTEISSMKSDYFGRNIKIGDSMTTYTYQRGSSSYRELMKDFYYNGTEMEALVDMIAEVKYTLLLDSQSAESKMVVFCIDGNWYVG